MIRLNNINVLTKQFLDKNYLLSVCFKDTKTMKCFKEKNFLKIRIEEIDYTRSVLTFQVNRRNVKFFDQNELDTRFEFVLEKPKKKRKRGSRGKKNSIRES